jgi:hypothetical protein
VPLLSICYLKHDCQPYYSSLMSLSELLMYCRMGVGWFFPSSRLRPLFVQTQCGVCIVQNRGVHPEIWLPKICSTARYISRIKTLGLEKHRSLCPNPSMQIYKRISIWEASTASATIRLLPQTVTRLKRCSYSLECNDIREGFFTHHPGHCCTNVILGSLLCLTSSFQEYGPTARLRLRQFLH